MSHPALTPSAAPLPEWAQIDPDWYARSYLAGPGAASDAAAHYAAKGKRLGHSPNPFFDELWYRLCHPEVAKAIAQGHIASGFDDYCARPAEDRSPHWLFDAGFARAQMGPEDLRGHVNSYAAFLAHGDRAGLRPSRFLLPARLLSRLDPSQHGAVQEEGLFHHFLSRYRSSLPELPLSPYFDPDWYLRAHPSAAASILRGSYPSALAHYLLHQGGGGVDPLPQFSERGYLSLHPDVAGLIAGGTCASGYDHFLRFGMAEGRRFGPMIDLARYRADNPQVQADLAQGRAPDAFAHFLMARDLAAAAPPAPVLPEDAAKALFTRRAEALAKAATITPLDFTCTGTPEVTVVMVLHNKLELTLAVLAEVATQLPGRLELILADSGSTDGTRGIGTFLRGARILRFDENINFVRACNAGLAKATGRAVLYLNNDIRLAPQAIRRALARLSSAPDIGAVGGLILRSHGLIQDAGCIIWADGSTEGYLRDAPATTPEANFTRDVDFCSGAFLMVRRDLAQAMGGFDMDYAPAYYEETDFCVRLRQGGWRVVYDPGVLVEHLEYGSSAHSRDAVAMMRRNHAVFVEKHRDWLLAQPRRGAGGAAHARSPRRAEALRILLIEDQLPLRHLGSGFVRSHDILTSLVGLGHEVTLFPIQPRDPRQPLPPDALPDRVERMEDRGGAGMAAFLAEREGFFDRIWICRTHNLDHLAQILAAIPAQTRPAVILDTEAVGALRDIQRARTEGKAPPAIEPLLQHEFRNIALADHVVAVSPAEAALLAGVATLPPATLGHMRHLRADCPDFAARADLLFVGAILQPDAPNLEALRWFVREVLPQVTAALGPEVRLTVAGTTGQGVDLAEFADHPQIRLLGSVPDLAPLQDAHRLFIAPTRIAAGLPYKLHEAASHGLPIVATDLLAQQLGWQSGDDLLAASEPAAFATAVVQLYTSADLWRRLRDAALARVQRDHSPEVYAATLEAILRAAGRSA